MFVTVAVIQILTRPGFDLTHQALSLLTLGSWGWVQSANYFHGMLHMVCGSLAFQALIALCFVLARKFLQAGHRRWAIISRIAVAACAIGVVTAGAPGTSLDCANTWSAP